MDENNNSETITEGGVEQFGYTQELKRALSLWDLVVYGLVSAVPIAPFVIYGYVVNASSGMVALAYIMTGIGMLFTANSYAQMSQAFPLAGAAYAFTSYGIERHVGFLLGWMLVFAYIMIPPLMYVFCANALNSIIPQVPPIIWLFMFIIVNTTINYFGIEVTEKANKIILYGQLIVLAWFVIACIVAIAKGVNEASLTIQPIYNAQHFGAGIIMAAVSIAVLNFIGTDAITTLAEETKGGIKACGRGMIIAVIFLAVFFGFQTYLAGAVWPDYAAHTNPDIAFYEICELVGGQPLKWAVSLAVAIAIGFACSMCFQSSNARVIYAMSRDNMFPKIFSKVHPKYKSPYISVFFIGAVSVIVCLLFAERGEELTAVVNFGALLSFAMVNISCFSYFIIKKKSKNIFLHLICPFLGLFVTGYAWLSLAPISKIIGFSILGVGILFMIYLKYIKRVEFKFAEDVGV